MRKKLIAGLLIGLLLLASPAHAADGDAAIVLDDQTTYTLLCTSYATNYCTRTLTSGHVYGIVAQTHNLSDHASKIVLTIANSNTRWDNEGFFCTSNGGGTPILIVDSGPNSLKATCYPGTPGYYLGSLGFVGTANSTSDGTSNTIITNHYGTAQQTTLYYSTP